MNWTANVTEPSIKSNAWCVSTRSSKGNAERRYQLKNSPPWTFLARPADREVDSVFGQVSGRVVEPLLSLLRCFPISDALSTVLRPPAFPLERDANIPLQPLYNRTHHSTRYVAFTSLDKATFLILFLASFLEFHALHSLPVSAPKEHSLRLRIFISSNENKSLSWPSWN